MEVFECIYSRRSVRKFQNKAVEKEKLMKALDAARFAPSAGNLQDWKFIVVDDKEKKEKIAEACLNQYFIEEAPYVVVVVSEIEKLRKHYGLRGERLYSIQDCAAAIQNFLLALHSQGLASCWVGAFDEEKLKRILEIPDDVRPQAVLPVGYPAEQPELPRRYPLESVVHINVYGNRIADISEYLKWYSVKIKKKLDQAREKILSLFKKYQKEE